MERILRLVDALKDSANPNGKSAIHHVGFISCGNVTHIRHVPFHAPCLILVLSGRKVIFEGEKPIVCQTGDIVSVPAPASFDLRNEPDPKTRKYRALIIPFSSEDLERLRRLHDIDHQSQHLQAGLIRFRCDDSLGKTIEHYLNSPDDPRVLLHRLMELLLVLTERDGRLLTYPLLAESWSNRVRAVLSSDLTRVWSISEVCQRLTTSESTLRRNLRAEGAGFRELLYDLRLTSALMLLLQTPLPVYRVAYDCGYQSVSRFSNNFRKRFGLSPTEFRASVNENEQKLAAGEHLPGR